MKDGKLFFEIFFYYWISHRKWKINSWKLNFQSIEKKRFESSDWYFQDSNGFFFLNDYRREEYISYIVKIFLSAFKYISYLLVIFNLLLIWSTGVPLLLNYPRSWSIKPYLWIGKIRIIMGVKFSTENLKSFFLEPNLR